MLTIFSLFHPLHHVQSVRKCYDVMVLSIFFIAPAVLKMGMRKESFDVSPACVDGSLSIEKL